jgi:hypothetical protein
MRICWRQDPKPPLIKRLVLGMVPKQCAQDVEETLRFDWDGRARQQSNVVAHKASQQTRQEEAKCLAWITPAHLPPPNHNKQTYRPQPWRSRQWPATWARTRRPSKWTVGGWQWGGLLLKALELGASTIIIIIPPLSLLWSGKRRPDSHASHLHVHFHRNPVVQLYRTISKELPRVLTIYDADLAPAEVRPWWVGGKNGGGLD